MSPLFWPCKLTQAPFLREHEKQEEKKMKEIYLSYAEN